LEAIGRLIEATKEQWKIEAIYRTCSTKLRRNGTRNGEGCKGRIPAGYSVGANHTPTLHKSEGELLEYLDVRDI
jgi:hypothetical protein